MSTTGARIACLSAALFVPTMASAAPVIDKPDLETQWQDLARFDLERDCRKPVAPSGDAHEAKGSEPAQPDTWASEVNGLTASEELGPRWSVQRGAKGPILQFAALGAGKKKRPGLAHLAIDWSF